MSAPAAAGAVAPFDAWCFVGGEVEPLGAHWTEEAALEALGHMDGGAVTAGMTFLRWHSDTSTEARAQIRDALKPHGITARTQPKGGDAPW